MDLNIKTSNGKEYVLPIESQHEMSVRNVIHRHDNPNPILLICIVIIIVILIYYIYLCGLKKNITGAWYVDNSSTYVNHNVWTDKLYISGYECGYVSGSAVFIYNADSRELPFMGTLYDRKIYWSNGTVWTHIRYA
jgi:hypothetical protein